MLCPFKLRIRFRTFSVCISVVSRRAEHGNKAVLYRRITPTFCISSRSFYSTIMTETPITLAAAATAGGFKGTSDIYSGVSVDTKELNFSDEEFESSLKKALVTWHECGVRGVWFKVQIKDASYIPVLVKHSFVFHHAKESYAMLTRWLPEDEPNMLPRFPHTHVGVGGMVVNEKDQVLVIQERYAQKPHWKLPGGYSNPGENFADTAQREVLEETGINSEFLSVVTFRHQHQHIFECSDIYVVCLMMPLDSEIKSNKEEISQCQWMDITDYVNHPQVTDFNRRVMEAFLESRRLKVAIFGSPVLSFRKDCYHQLYAVQSLPTAV